MSRLVLFFAFMIQLGCTEYKLGSSEDGLSADDTADAWGSGDDGPAELEDPSSYDGQITGRVCDPSGSEEDGWVVGAYVYTNYDSDGDGVDDAIAEASTDEAGRFTLFGLPTGRDYVIYVVKGSFEATFEVTLTTGTYEIPEDECRLEPPNIAVVTGDYDHIEDIISGMGLDFTTYDGNFGATEYRAFLTDPTAMAEYDIIFFNCGISDTWIDMEREIIKENIRSFVQNGGSIYVSDWAWFFVELPFPAKIDFYGDDLEYRAPMVGREGSVSANVIDITMQAIIGAVGADINFDLPMWVVMQGVGPDVSTLLEATVQAADLFGSFTTLSSVPIAARFDVGESGGRVIYTAFHNEHAATTLDMTDILEEIILSL